MADLSLTELAVLGLLAEGPTHGFALAKELDPNSDVGRIFSIRRPLVYRALDRLVEHGYAEPAHIEQSDSGPNRVVHRVTGRGRRHLDRWLDDPVEHVRDIRIELLLKLTLLHRSKRSSLPLISAQRESLDATLEALEDEAAVDHVDLWRRHSARAVRAYLDDMAAMYG